MSHLTNEQKAHLYNTYLFQYQRVQEQIRQIKSQNFELSESDERKVRDLEMVAKRIYDQTARLY